MPMIAQMKQNRGYNRNLVLRRSSIPGQVAEAAVLHDPASGRTPTLSTGPAGAVSLHTANFISTDRRDEGRGEVSAARRRGAGDRAFPGLPTSRISPLTTLMPGEAFKSRTVLAFTAK